MAVCQSDLRRLHNDRDSPRLDSFLDAQCNLLSQSFLHLQPTAESFGNAGQFGDAENKLVWDVCNGDLN
jgi:hypothetical protein